LEDGKEFLQTELFIARKLKEMKARRSEDGNLEIFDPHDQEYKRFSGKLFVHLSGIDPSITERGVEGGSKTNLREKEKETLQFSTSPARFSEKYLPNLLREGIISLDDFRISGKGKASELFRTTDKHFGGANPYVYFSSEEGGGVKYYLGRNNLVGTKAPITPDMVVRQLDSNTVVIIDKSYGKERAEFFLTC